MPKVKLSVPADSWSHSEGSRGATVRVAENWEKNGAVYLFRTVDRRPVKRALHEYLGQAQPFMLRNSRGEILAGQRKKAVEAAQACVADLALGLDPFRGTKKAAPAADASRPTIKNAFDEALRSTKGSMFVVDSNHKKEMLRAADHALAALRTGPGSNDFPLAEEIAPGTAQTVWRHFLAQATHVRDKVRSAERSVAVVYQVLKWLHERHPTRYPHAPKPLTNWFKVLVGEWETKFSDRYEREEDDRPRFSEEEVRLIFDSLHKADPRLALMIEIGPDQRAGQVIRSTRRDLDLVPGSGGLGYGQINLLRHARGRKATTIVDLHASARAAIDHALGPGGYLHHLEQAFQAGELEDYYLWPAGKLSSEGMRLDTYLHGSRKGRDATHLELGWLIKLFRRYQEEIGVEIVKGRQFYGLRRVLADLAEDVESDTRALRELTGWKSEDMRRHYQRKRNAKVTKKAAVARANIRALIAQGEVPPADDGLPDLEGYSAADLRVLLERLTDRLRGAAA